MRKAGKVYGNYRNRSMVLVIIVQDLSLTTAFLLKQNFN